MSGEVLGTRRSQVMANALGGEATPACTLRGAEVKRQS